MQICQITFQNVSLVCYKYVINYKFLQKMIQVFDNRIAQNKQFEADGADEFIKVTQNIRDRIGVFFPLAISFIPDNCQSVIDLGCGNAQYHERILQKRKNIKRLIGLDISKRMIEMVSEKLKQREGNEYIQHNLIYPFPIKKQVECMISIITLEYNNFDELNRYMKNCYDALFPQGKVVFISVQYSRYKNHPVQKNLLYLQILQETENWNDGQKFVGRIVNQDKDLHLFYWKTQTLISILEKCGFKAHCQYLTADNIDPNLYTAEEIELLVSSKLVRCIVGIKPSQNKT